jgi:hypothetical protein
MQNHANHPSAHEALSMLASIHPQIHTALDHGAFKSRAYFESEGTRLERSLQSMLVRYHAKMQLQEKFPEVVFDQFSLCGISLLCKNLSWKGRPVNCRLRLWKSFSNELPPPGDSNGKRVFYTQPQLEMFPDGSPNESEQVSEIKFAILWNLNSKGLLQPLWLVCPKNCNRKTGEIKVWWDIPIPDPALAVRESKAPRKREDLPMERKKTEEQQSS